MKRTRTQIVMETITLSELAKMFGEGKFATVSFIKKGDGSLRLLNGKTKVLSAMVGGEASYDASSKNQLRVCDVNVRKDGVRTPSYRTVTVDNVVDVRSNGVVYHIIREPKGKSSFIEKHSYTKGAMYMRMNGRSYNYLDVPFETYKQFALAKSQGSFYNEFIKGKFIEERVYGK